MFKHLLLSINILIAATFVSAAEPYQREAPPGMPERRAFARHTPQNINNNYCVQSPFSRADGSMRFTFARRERGVASSFYNSPADGLEIAAAVALDKTLVAQYAGCKITKVIIPTSHDCKGMPVTVFVTDDSQDLTKNNVKGLYEANQGVDNTFTLSEPVEIKGDKTIYIGFTAVSDRNKYPWPYPIDDIPTDNENSCLSAVKENGRWDWDSRSYYGALCISAVIEGDNLPENIGIIEVSADQFVNTGSDINVDIALTNRASNPINDFEVQITVADQQPEIFSFNDINLQDYNMMSHYYRMNLKCTASGNNIPVIVRLTKVNGVEQEMTSETQSELSILSLPDGIGYKRNMVVEEFTGTWCGFCPRGIVGLENMLANHSDGTFIPIAVHMSDEMHINYGYYAAGAPTCNINRMSQYTETDPAEESLGEAYNNVTSLPAFATIGITAKKSDDDKSVSISTTTEFAMDASGADYGIAYVITENGVGPYVQHNYYSGDPYAPGDWGSKPDEVSIKFNDVARYISSYDGEAVFTGDITGGKRYEHQSVVNIPAGVDVDNCHFIALLINRKNGVIENAVMATKAETSGIEDLPEQGDNNADFTVDNGTLNVTTGSVEVFSADGRRVATATPLSSVTLPVGLYLVRTASGVAKIAIR